MGERGEPSDSDTPPDSGCDTLGDVTEDRVRDLLAAAKPAVEVPA